MIASVIVFSIGVQRSEIQLGRDLGFPFVRVLIAPQLQADLLDSLSLADPAKANELQNELARIAPLNPITFEAGLSMAFERSDDLKANEFASATLTRQPRSLAARLFRFNAASKRRSYAELIEEYEILYALNTIDRTDLNEAFFGVMRESRDWTVLTNYLGTNPESSLSLISLMIENAWQEIDLVELVDQFPESQTSYLWKLIDNGKFEEARGAWLQFEELSEDELLSVPFNSQFESRSENEPFNWMLMDSIAEYEENGGILVSYNGRKPETIARQIIGLTPGDYILRTEAEGRISRSEGQLVWLLKCLQSGELIADLPIQLERFEQLEVLQIHISIDHAQCSHQVLELNGQPGEFPKTSVTRVRSIDFIKAFATYE